MSSNSLAFSTAAALSLVALLGTAAAAPPRSAVPAFLNPLVALETRDPHPHHRRRRQAARPQGGGGAGRRADAADAADTCPGGAAGAQHVWSLTPKDSSVVAAYGIGSMHLPVAAVTDPAAWASLQDVATLGCDVYGELDLSDPSIQDSVNTCVGRLRAPALVPISALRNATVKAAVVAKVDELAAEIVANTNVAAADVSEQLQGVLSVQDVLSLAPSFNAGGVLRESVIAPFRSEPSPPILDDALLSLGRAKHSLETVSAQCKVMEMLYEDTKDELLAGENTTFGAAVIAGLTETSPLVAWYRCKSSTEFKTSYETSVASADMQNTDLDILLYDRNKIIVDRMTAVMSQASHPPVFVVGLAHWQIGGTKSMEAYLDAKGYTMTALDAARVQALPQLSDADCAAPKQDDDASGSVPTPKAPATLVVAAAIAFYQLL